MNKFEMIGSCSKALAIPLSAAYSHRSSLDFWQYDNNVNIYEREEPEESARIKCNLRGKWWIQMKGLDETDKYNLALGVIRIW